MMRGLGWMQASLTVPFQVCAFWRRKTSEPSPELLAEVEEDILGVLAVGEDLVLEVLGAGGDEASIQRDLEDVADDVKTVVHGQSPI